MYIIYAGYQYYTKGGANDIIGFYNTYDITLKMYQQIFPVYDWIHILDIETKDIVKEHYKK
jgi:hypothetical protein